MRRKTYKNIIYTSLGAIFAIFVEPTVFRLTVLIIKGVRELDWRISRQGVSVS